LALKKGILFFLISWAVVVLLTGVIAVSGRPVEGWGPFERIITEAVAPLQRTLRGAVRSIGRLVDRYVDLVHVQRENEELKKQINTFRFEIGRLHEESETAKRLKELLHFTRSSELSMVPAQVVGRDPSGFSKTLTIDKGNLDGVFKDMAVINHEGVVGRVVAASPHYAKVLLVIDQNSSVDALTCETRYRGILVGISDDRCELKYISPMFQIQKDENVITSGFSPFFPKGLVLGAVEHTDSAHETMFQKVAVRPAVDFSRLEEVLVIIEHPYDQKELP
jgi:rod shape-determining protein MreC